MKKLTGWAASWLLFILGDLAYKVCRIIDNRYTALAYLRIMNASSSVQDWGGGKGPWSPIIPKRRLK